MAKIKVGDFIAPQTLKTISESSVEVPSTQQITHLQFRRFASCPICNLHIHSFIQKHLDLVANGIQEVVVYHSSQEELLKYSSNVPFAMVADPTKALYKSFGVETSLMSILHPASWISGIAGLFKFRRVPHEKGQGHLGLPADFLIDKTGKVIAVKYGVHADDHWEVDEVIAQAL